jgi:hypothetical protein
MAILGESFKDYVIRQINTRQEKLSALDKDNALLKYLSSKTSFIRLTSGVDIDENLLTYYNLPFTYGTKENLAKQFVLEAAKFKNQNDTTESPSKFTSGVGYSDVATSYGFSSDSDYGLVPPPGITMVSVKTLNRGTIREATIQLVCHNIYQFNIINILFLKLKYSILLEWGHTVYYNNAGELVTGYEIPNLSNDFLTKRYPTSAELLKVIEDERRKSCGNYDVFYGFVKNFEWQVEENGSYTITISALSQGDIIDSIKINTDFDPTKREGSSTPQFNKSTLHKILGAIRNKLKSEKYLNGYNNGDGKFALNTPSLASILPVNSTGSRYNYRDWFDNNNVINKSEDSNYVLTEKEGLTVVFPKLEVSQNANGQNVQTAQYYIKLGTFLRIIESFTLFYDTTKNVNANHTKILFIGNTSKEFLQALGFENNNTLSVKKLIEAISQNNESLGHPPIFHIDHNFETNECLTLPTQLTVNPLVALIPLYTSGSQPEAPITVSGIFKQSRKRVVYPPTVPDTAKSVGDSNWVEEEQILGEEDELARLQVSTNTNYVTLASVPTNWGTSDSDFSVDIDILKSNNKEITTAGTYLSKANTKVPVYKEGDSIVPYIQFDEFRYKRTIVTIERGNVGTLKDIDYQFKTKDPYIGKTMHIYVNTQHIVNVLDSKIDNNGTVPLQDFLTTLLQSIGSALGSVNNFDLDYNASTNTFSVVDSAVIPLKYPNTEQLKAVFNINSFSPNRLPNERGSFVNSFSLKSEIFSSIGNAIALGSRGDGTTTTGIGKIYTGVSDRWFQKFDNNLITLKLRTPSEEEAFVKQQYVTYEGKLKNANKTGPSLTQEDIDYYTSYVVDLFQHDLGVATANGNDDTNLSTTRGIPGTGFIPLNLQLNIDGLSGLTQYQTFEISPNILPPEYNDKIKFITTTIEHKIDTKGWETVINTLGMPKKKK